MASPKSARAGRSLGWRKLKTNSGTRVFGPSEQSVAIELGSVFVPRREPSRVSRREEDGERSEERQKHTEG